MKTFTSINKLKQIILTYKFWLIMAILIFIIQSSYDLFHVRTWFDEGNYSYKGYITVKGIFKIYEDGGPYYEYTPLAFYVPGIIQVLFGPSFIVGRLFSILCFALAVFVTYRAAEKLYDKRAALISIWFIIGNIVLFRYYITISPYSWVSLFLMLSLLALASKISSPYREIIAVFMITVAYATRQNMLISFGLIVLYALITQRKLHHYFIIAASSIFFPVLFIAPFWPEINNEVFSSLPVVGNFFNELSPHAKLATKGIFRVWSFDKFIEGMNWLLNFHFPVLFAFLFTIIWSIKSSINKENLLKTVSENRLLIFISLLFFVNLIIHIIIPQSYCTRCPAVYIGYFFPTAALINGIGLLSFWKTSTSNKLKYTIVGIIIGSAILLSFFTKAITFTINPPKFDMIQNAADRIAALTKEDDKIFCISEMHVFLLAKRVPYPALITGEFNYVITQDTQNAVKQNRWNYELAKQWLSEADVVILSYERFNTLERLYPGHPGSGEDLKKLIEQIIAKDFPYHITVICSYGDNIEVYRRRAFPQVFKE